MSDKYVGKRIDGRYEIHELIGVGGMAYVYKAFDKSSERWVAVKILKEELAGKSEFLRRFRNESRAIAVLSHPNIVKVVDVSFGDRLQYIVMEYIDGITLKEYITRKGVIPWREALYFTVQILKALSHAHDNGIIHRDVKPQNIMLLQDGTIKVTDFGIARFSQSETQTMTGKALGSVHYIAPEQARGEFTSHRADLYSLGVMMYEMFTGVLPFEADNAVSVAIMQLQADAKKPRSINPQLPLGIEEITMKAMEKKPAKRFQSAEEMLSDIEKFRQNPSISFNYNQNFDMGSTIQMDIQSEVKVKHEEEYQDNFEYEEELVKSTRHARGTMIISGVIAALVVVIIIFAVNFAMDFLNRVKDPVEDEILLPNFVGMMYDSQIKGNSNYEDNFKITTQIVVDEDAQPGEVVRQSPAGDIMVKIGKEIILYVNEETIEPVEVDIPGVVGQIQTEAYNMIKTAGFNPVIKTIADDDTAENYVIRTEPASGEKALEGTDVIIYVSKGKAEIPVRIPNVVGESLADAQYLIEESGLKVEIKYDDDSLEAKDQVVDSSPESGDIVEKGSKVTLKVSSGKHVDKNITVSIPLPSGVNYDVPIKIYVNGLTDHATTVNPTYTSNYTFNVTGKTGTQSIVVQLDGKEYLFGTVNYDEQTFTVDSVKEFATPTPSPTPTPTPTPDPTPVPQVDDTTVTE